MKSFLKVIQLHKSDRYRNETELIQSAAKQNRAAQQTLFELFSPKMLSVCRYYIKDRHHAEEVLLNGFLKVFKYIKDYRFQGSFEGWVRRIMVRESISFLRGKKTIEFPTEHIGAFENQSQYIDTDFDVEDIQRLIDSLPDGYRMVFNMFAIEGYKHSEIATLLKISENTSKSQLFKARKVLQQKIIQLNTTNNGTH